MPTEHHISKWLLLALPIILGSFLMDCMCGYKEEIEFECEPPIADAGPDQTHSTMWGTPITVTLSGYGSMPGRHCTDEHLVSFDWTLLSPPDHPITFIDIVDYSTIVELSEVGQYVFQLEVTDSNGDTGEDTVVINIVDGPVCPPTADAGPDQMLKTTTGTPVTVTLDGSRSHADMHCPHSDLVRYTWTVASQPNGSGVAIQNADEEQASVQLSIAGEYEFQLEVEAAEKDTDTDVMMVTLVEDCESDLVVTVIDAASRTPVVAADVTVSHASGGSDSAATDASGVAAFALTGTFPPRSVTVSSAEMVPSLIGSGPDRPKYELTSVLDYSG